MVDSKTVNDRLKLYCGPYIAVNVAHYDLPDDKGETRHLIVVHVPPNDALVPAQNDGTYEESATSKKQCTAFYRGQILVRSADQSIATEIPIPVLTKNLKPIRTKPAPAFSNPYDINHTASRHMFKGRQEEIERLLDAIETGTHAAIFGLRRIGKTSLFEETLTNRISEREGLKGSTAFAKIDFQRIGSDSMTYKVMAQVLMRAVAEAVSSDQLDMVEGQIDHITRRYDTKKGMLLALSDIVERMTLASKKRIVLFLDEFSELCKTIERNEDLLRRNPDRFLKLRPQEFLVDVEFMQWFSALIKRDRIKDKLVIVFAVRPFVAAYDKQRSLELLKLMGTVITLYHLEEPAAKALMREPLAGVIEITHSAADYLYQLTSGHPYLIQLFLKNIVDRLKRRNRRVLDEADIRKFETEMVSEGPAYDAHFQVLDSDYSIDDVMNPKRAKIGNGVLALISKIGNETQGGWVKVENLCHILVTCDCPPEDTYTILDQLLQSKIIEELEIEGKYHVRMSIPLLRKRYVKQNLYLKYFPGRSARA
jgi:AAA ATPase domain